MMRPAITIFGTLGGGVLLYVASTKLLGIVGKEPWMTIALFGSFIAAAVASWRIARRLFPRPPRALTIQELRAKGLIEKRQFTARRAFQVDQFEDEGLSYFLELADGRVLFLSGQYLEDIEELTEEGDYKDRKFPCAEFQLERRKDTGKGIDIEPLSPFFGVEAEFPPFTTKDVKAGLVPADGTILTQPYDVLKERIANRPMK